MKWKTSTTRERLFGYCHRSLYFAKGFETKKVNAQYYGVTKDDDKKIIKVRLNENEIKKIRVLDKSISTLLIIGAIIIPVGIGNNYTCLNS